MVEDAVATLGRRALQFRDSFVLNVEMLQMYLGYYVHSNGPKHNGSKL